MAHVLHLLGGDEGAACRWLLARRGLAGVLTGFGRSLPDRRQRRANTVAKLLARQAVGLQHALLGNLANCLAVVHTNGQFHVVDGFDDVAVDGAHGRLLAR